MGRMFVTSDELAELEQAIAVTGNNTEHWRDKYRDNGLSDMRFRWDLFWTTDYAWRRDWIGRIYDRGGHDDHIDTALRRVVERQDA